MRATEGSSAAPDAVLASRIAEAGGDREAEAILCARFAPRVRAYGLRHLRSEAAADDLVQRVLVLTVEKLRSGEVREPGRIASFVLGSARLCCAEVRRGAARHESFDPDHPAARRLAQPPAEPVDRTRLVACLAQLSERERSVVVLTFFEDCAADEIGATLGLSAGNVRVVRHRALAKLRAMLSPESEGWA